MNCEDRSGFLFAHDCDRQAQLACSSCGKQVCGEHAHDADAGGGGRKLCATCLRAAPAGQDTSLLSNPYLYAAGALAGYHYYDALDRRAFDRRPPEAGARSGLESDLDGS